MADTTPEIETTPVTKTVAVHSDQKPDPFLTVADVSAWKAGRREWLIIACLCIINACVALDATVVVPPLPVSAICCST